MSLGLLAPDLQRTILENRISLSLATDQILSMNVPIAWEDQRQVLGPLVGR